MNNQPARQYSVAAFNASRAANPDGVPDKIRQAVQRVSNWLTARGTNDPVAPGELKKVAAYHRAASAMHREAGQAEAADAHELAAKKWEGGTVGTSISAGAFDRSKSAVANAEKIASKMNQYGEPGSGTPDQIKRRLNARGEVFRELDRMASSQGTEGRYAYVDKRRELLPDNQADLAALNRGGAVSAAAPKTQAEAMRQSTMLIGGGKGYLAMTPEKQEIAEKVLAAKDRASVERLIGPAATQRYYNWLIGGSSKITSLVSAMQWKTYPSEDAAKQAEASLAAQPLNAPPVPTPVNRYGLANMRVGSGVNVSVGDGRMTQRVVRVSENEWTVNGGVKLPFDRLLAYLAYKPNNKKGSSMSMQTKPAKMSRKAAYMSRVSLSQGVGMAMTTPSVNLVVGSDITKEFEALGWRRVGPQNSSGLATFGKGSPTAQDAALLKKYGKSLRDTQDSKKTVTIRDGAGASISAAASHPTDLIGTAQRFSKEAKDPGSHRLAANAWSKVYDRLMQSNGSYDAVQEAKRKASFHTSEAAKAGASLAAGGDDLLSRIESFAGVSIRPGRNTIKGYPVDIADQSPAEGLEMVAVDQDAATGLLKAFRAAGINATRSGNKGIVVRASLAAAPPTDDTPTGQSRKAKFMRKMLGGGAVCANGSISASSSITLVSKPVSQEDAQAAVAMAKRVGLMAKASGLNKYGSVTVSVTGDSGKVKYLISQLEGAAGASISAAAGYSVNMTKAIKQVIGNNPPVVKEAMRVLKESGPSELLAWAEENMGKSVADELRRNGIAKQAGMSAGSSFKVGDKVSYPSPNPGEPPMRGVIKRIADDRATLIDSMNPGDHKTVPVSMLKPYKAGGKELPFAASPTLSPADRQLRQNVRNFLMTATLDELKKELAISKQRGDAKRAQFVQELINEEGEASLAASSGNREIPINKLQAMARDGRIEYGSDPKPGMHIEVKWPNGKKEWVMVRPAVGASLAASNPLGVSPSGGVQGQYFTQMLQRMDQGSVRVIKSKIVWKVASNAFIVGDTVNANSPSVPIEKAVQMLMSIGASLAGGQRPGVKCAAGPGSNNGIAVRELHAIWMLLNRTSDSVGKLNATTKPAEDAIQEVVTQLDRMVRDIDFAKRQALRGSGASISASLSRGGSSLATRSVRSIQQAIDLLFQIKTANEPDKAAASAVVAAMNDLHAVGRKIQAATMYGGAGASISASAFDENVGQTLQQMKPGATLTRFGMQIAKRSATEYSLAPADQTPGAKTMPLNAAVQRIMQAQ